MLAKNRMFDCHFTINLQSFDIFNNVQHNSSMGYIVHIKGVPVEAKTATDAIALVQQWAALEKATPSNVVVGSAFTNMATQHGIGSAIHHMRPNPALVPVPVVPIPTLVRTLNFLKLIEDAGDAGVETSDLMEVLGTDSPRGVGAKVRPIKNAVLAIGYGNTDNVFYVDREGADESTWHSGPFISEAINELEVGLGLKKA